MDHYIPGQRWFSTAELELGLGTVVSIDHRTLTVSFSASDETRTYALHNAPLTRVSINIGDAITTIDGQKLVISDISVEQGLFTYTGNNPSGDTITLDERDLNHTMQLNQPIDRVFSGQIDKSRSFELRYQTQQHLNRLTHSDLSGLTGCRTSLIPHQLYIAHEVANRYAPRVLLADEVGLGKTIEAGLIIHHQLINERAKRVLIIVPESLMHQWLVEMLRRFNLKFSLFDEQRFNAITSDDNHFLSEQLILCSLEFLTQSQTAYEQAIASQWDLLIMDEAHHLEWTPDNASIQYQLVESLTKKIPGVLLLTATPEQLGLEGHFARLRLLDPDRFSTLSDFVKETKDYQAIAHVMETLLSDVPLDNESITRLKSALKEEYDTKSDDFNPLEISTALNELADPHSTISDDKRTQLQQTLLEHMLDRHGTGRVLFRNTRTAVKGFPGRKVHAYALTIADTQIDTATETLSDNYHQLLLEFIHLNQTSAWSDELISQLIFPEQYYQTYADNHDLIHWTQIDPRVQWLGDWLLQQSKQKIVVIASKTTTAIELADYLKRHYGIYLTVFHENLTIIERDRAAAYFADPDQGAQVLICSEIGSEGRNFQFAHQMVLFDLPLNPDLLEQRIGRLDRIGQTETIQIHVPYLDNTAQARLFDWYHDGLNVFEHTCPTAHTIFTELKSSLFDILVNDYAIKDKERNNSTFRQFVSQTQSLQKNLNSSLQEGKDKLLEFNSCRQPQAHELTQLALDNENHQPLFDYIDSIFDVLGIEQTDHSEQCYIIAPSEHMLHQFPDLPDDGLTITYDRAVALANEDMQFFTWDHPMVRTAMDMMSQSELGNTALTTIEGSQLPVQLPAGSLLLECLFRLEATAHDTLHADRYLPPTLFRVLVDEQGHDLSLPIPHELIESPQEAIPTSTAQQIVTMKSSAIKVMLNNAEQHCKKQSPEILQSAKLKSQQLLESEINRLKALSMINSLVRVDEIDFYNKQLSTLNQIFEAVEARLDALRIVIVT